MANLCAVTIEIISDDIAAAERRITEWMKLPILQPEGNIPCRNTEICIGHNRYLFDITVGLHPEESNLSIHCFAKWSVFDEDVIHIIRFLKNDTMIKKILITYDEPGRALYGQYEFSMDDDFIIDTYLPEESYPAAVSGLQSGGLEEALCKFGIQNFIKYPDN